MSHEPSGTDTGLGDFDDLDAASPAEKAAVPGGSADDPSPVRLIVTLSLAGLVSGLAIVGIYEATLPAITQNKKDALQAAIFEVVPGSAKTQALRLEGESLVADPQETSPVVYAGYAEDGRFLGYAVPSDGAGYQDTVEILFGYEPKEKKVTGMRVLASRETPGLGDKIIKDMAFVSQFESLSTTPSVVLVKGEQTADLEIEAITGATISSRAVVKIMNGGLAEQVPRMPEPGKEPVLEGPGGGEGGS